MTLSQIPLGNLILAAIVIGLTLHGLAALGYAFHQYVNDRTMAALGGFCMAVPAWLMVGFLLLKPVPVIGVTFLLFTALIAAWSVPMFTQVTRPPSILLAEALTTAPPSRAAGWVTAADARRAANLGGGYRTPSGFDTRRPR